ncbi:MAG: hypothetical protein M3Z23_18280 [Acidobacteriota bacterium]|nr:hypothetical protein [Acidobacteriota bacterium]
MKTFLAFGVSLFLAAAAHGQYRGGNYNSYGSFSGFGSVVFPGTGHPPAGGNFSITNPGFASRLGSTVNGSVRGPYGARSRRGIGSLPYSYPVYVGGGYGNGYDPAYASGYGEQQPNVTVVAPPPQQQAPQLIINQNFGVGAGGPSDAQNLQNGTAQEGDGFHMYQAPARSIPEPQAADPRYYLIAYKDHSIYSALAYWLEDNTLHYVTTQNTHNQASLDLIDLDFTKRLNQDRNVAFTLTPSR